MKITVGKIEIKIAFLITSNGNIIEFGMMYPGVKDVIQAAIYFLRTRHAQLLGKSVICDKKIQEKFNEV